MKAFGIYTIIMPEAKGGSWKPSKLWTKNSGESSFSTDELIKLISDLDALFLGEEEPPYEQAKKLAEFAENLNLSSDEGRGLFNGIVEVALATADIKTMEKLVAVANASGEFVLASELNWMIRYQQAYNVDPEGESERIRGRFNRFSKPGGYTRRLTAVRTRLKVR